MAERPSGDRQPQLKRPELPTSFVDLGEYLNQSTLLFPYSWDFPGKNVGVGSHFLLQGIFLTQESNPRPLHWQDSLQLSLQGGPHCVLPLDSNSEVT